MSTAAGYVTDVPYFPGFYPNLSPVAIRYAASLNSVRPPSARNGFSYLELGCGLGRSINTHAAANPKGRFVAVDINPQHTAAVQRDADLGGLTNVQVITSDFAGLPDDLPQFDIIATHGVLSWVAPSVRQDIINIVRQRLAPGGLFLVSYNAMPGWAHLQPIRGILRHYAELRSGDSTSRMQEALSYLLFIRDKQGKYFWDNPRAGAYVDHLLTQDVRYLVHEFLNQHWTSFYFSEVASMFLGAGLSFTGTLPIHTNFWDLGVRPEFQELFLTTSDRLVTEAHKDFCANTAFRWDIYSKEPRPITSVEDRLDAVDDLYFSASRPGITLPFKTDLGLVTSSIEAPFYKVLLDLLGSGCMRLSQILEAPELSSMPREDLVRAIDGGVAVGMLDVTQGPLLDRTLDQNRPIRIVSRFNAALVRNESLMGRNISLASPVTGTGYKLNDLHSAALDELATRGHEGLADRVDARLVASGRSLHEKGNKVTDPVRRVQMVRESCDGFVTHGLPIMARLGIVENS